MKKVYAFIAKVWRLPAASLTIRWKARGWHARRIADTSLKLRQLP